ncbi:MAG: beta-lactamase domain protein [Nevskia sp.]|nr:beta-lactamase domain protein [Nevskia sp.]
MTTRGSSYKPTIAIIGGGFSGSLVAVQLLRRAERPLRIVLIERDDLPGRGIAYRDQPECHLLNVRAEAMSAFADDPDHFLNWLNSHYSPCHPVGITEYLPRRIYGAYVESLIAEAQQHARRGVSLEIRIDEVIGLRLSAEAASLRLRSNSRLRADRVVLACGNPGPADPPLADTRALGSRRYLGQAWSTPGLYSVSRDEDLLLIGSGLTALDWLASLSDRGHRGRIHVVSRRGLLPQAHRPVVPQNLSFDPLALPPRVLPLLRQLRREIETQAAAGGDWRSTMDALRPASQKIWQRLPLVEQQRFLRHLRPYWEVHRHRAAPRIVSMVDRLLRSGQMNLQAGRLIALNERDGSVDATIRLRADRSLQTLNVQRVINCTGPECDYRRLNHPLIVSLREQGLIEADALGLGLSTDDRGALIDAAAQPSTRLFTLGPPRKGQLWETTAVPEIRVQAQALAQQLLAQLVETPIHHRDASIAWL